MERNESRMTWLIIIGLIVVGGLASAVWPAISAQLNIGRAGELAQAREAPKPIVIDIENYLLGNEIMGLLSKAPQNVQDFVDNNINGREISQPVAWGILIALTVGSLVILGGPIALIYTRLEKSAAAIQEDDSYKAAVTVLDTRQQEKLKEKRQKEPSHISGTPAEDRRGFAYTMAFLGIIFAWVIGTVIGEAVYGSKLLETGNGQLINPVSMVSLIVLVIVLAAYILYFRLVRKPEDIDLAETDNAPVAWGWVWVIVSGLLIVGVGTGLALTLMSSGGTPPG